MALKSKKWWFWWWWWWWWLFWRCNDGRHIFDFFQVDQNWLYRTFFALESYWWDVSIEKGPRACSLKDISFVRWNNGKHKMMDGMGRNRANLRFFSPTVCTSKDPPMPPQGTPRDPEGASKDPKDALLVQVWSQFGPRLGSFWFPSSFPHKFPFRLPFRFLFRFRACFSFRFPFRFHSGSYLPFLSRFPFTTTVRVLCRDNLERMAERI